MPEIPGLDRELIISAMERAHIPGVSIAYMDNTTVDPLTTPIGRTDKRDSPVSTLMDSDSRVGAASLSKPVFAFLVLKLIEKGTLSRKGESAVSGLDRPLHEILPLENFFRDPKQTLSERDIERAKTITPRMLLAHISGINDFNTQLSFEPGTEYAYSGMGLIYLQAAIEEEINKSLGENEAKKSLQDLAKEHVFDKLSLNMSFVPPSESKVPIGAANSLYTTASDYAKLMNAWMNDKSPIMQEAFVPQISLINDHQVFPGGESAEHVNNDIKNRLSWGLGLGLEVDAADKKKAVKAFHTGDMNQWRAQMALDLDKKSCIVYFANADSDLKANGHTLGPLIITPKIPVDYAHTWFYSKFPFALHIDQLSEESRFGTRVQGEDKKADSDAVMAAFMSKSASTPAPSTHEKREASDASLEVQAGSSYAVMRALMPTQSPAPVSSPEITKQSTEESSHTMAVEVESLAETDKPSSPSPFKMTPKAPSDL
ncbi:MAG: serine hydrolase [Legionella sp.]|nr:serine hydrolase [Legionella sp.]